MGQHITSKYLITGERDRLWGVCVTSTGKQTIYPSDTYPPANHPTRYLFTPSSGRILDEFQLIYIVSGKGSFTSKSLGKWEEVREGDAFLLFPGEWHSYCPDTGTGWEERWIGFTGSIPEMWNGNALISKDNPVFHPGIHTRMVTLFNQALEYASSPEADYQKALGTTALELLGLTLYFDRNKFFRESDAHRLMVRARDIIIAGYTTITPEQTARLLGVGYSKFRKLFKEYYATSPGQFILKVKMANAGELLTNTDKQIQEIAWETGFENADYFTVSFKHMTGLTPSQYRNRSVSVREARR